MFREDQGCVASARVRWTRPSRQCLADGGEVFAGSLHPCLRGSGRRRHCFCRRVAAGLRRVEKEQGAIRPVAKVRQEAASVLDPHSGQQVLAEGVESDGRKMHSDPGISPCCQGCDASGPLCGSDGDQDRDHRRRHEHRHLVSAGVQSCQLHHGSQRGNRSRSVDSFVDMAGCRRGSSRRKSLGLGGPLRLHRQRRAPEGRERRGLWRVTTSWAHGSRYLLRRIGRWTMDRNRWEGPIRARMECRNLHLCLLGGWPHRPCCCDFLPEKATEGSEGCRGSGQAASDTGEWELRQDDEVVGVAVAGEARSGCS
mmetsp:Transcript_30989/g.86974  ORF Transcript_30989/g.86974 Transcript_30989/m.86974 type:complete len:311 (+) Transcript_30989:699-1631(+)